MDCRRFAINKTPYCVWGEDLLRVDLDFLDSLDSSYFDYVATTNLQLLEGDNAQHAALALRLTYSQALEAFLALLCATVQAPDCVVGWLQRYKDSELANLVRQIQRRESVLTKLRIKPVSWSSISDLVHIHFQLKDKKKEQSIKHNFGDLWNKLARDFLDDKTRREYNSIKHGHRVRLGGSRFAVGRETTPGVRAAPENMKIIDSSEFGSSFFFAEQINYAKNNLRLVHCFRNWDPESYGLALQLISMSMRNVISFLKVIHGADAETVQFSSPIEESDFFKPWERIGSTLTVGPTIYEKHIFPLSKEEILKVYQNQDGGT